MHRLIVSVVPKNSAEIVTAVANKAGSAGGSVLLGRGTASNSIIQLLGLGDTSKEIVLTIVEKGIASDVMSAISGAVAEKKHFGVMFSVAVPSFVKSGEVNGNATENGNPEKNNNKGEDDMAEAVNTKENAYEMINIIVNKGYAEDAMAAARKAGAGGGTILSARGTAKEGDEKFFGMEIVPEKEMLMILVTADKKDAVLGAVKALPCFEKAGSGIIFCSDVESFSVLGK
ncbi:MAG: transcriptional regulator [Treponemataceae bacterium]|nr:transcriptional regulator [Treponemataceae bacterium]